MNKAPTQTPVGRDALQAAIDKLTLSGLAAAMGVKYQLIQGWLADGRKYVTPAEYVLRVERASGVSREQLRPDIWGEVTQQ